ncbi:M15 family metallopeptidase [Pseudonocardia kunmingensis]|uniref:D-alanyl-D-alanine carboxypeptidase-like protein n=1 Tax=Pseudonocardia kunmingensis TaxID=630975 RepID=A0A543DYX0_9PSEU|nr:D-alanyl-D-alanine carboxypeptidase-like protein [Pseudonocardia kunmingensis]
MLPRPVLHALTAAVTAAAALSPGAVASGAERPPLPLRPDGYGVAQPTPPDLVDRRLPTRDLLPPPVDGEFAATVAPVPDDVLARSTWTPDCPVAPADLRYVTVAFRGFDGAAHTGELIVAARVADDVAAAFRELFAADFPIEEMRVVEEAELTAPPTGDDNNTTAFVCRPAVGLTRWSAHALGLAVDVNPFQNPYRKGDLVLPELASAYLDRDRDLPGMIVDGGPVVTAFERIGWAWGGRWRSPVDLHHFSATGT